MSSNSPAVTGFGKPFTKTLERTKGEIAHLAKLFDELSCFESISPVILNREILNMF
jgi:hypothetical protein